ncbi:hypothetical protein GDO78_015633 [Eleutherodactylus coqui]|uniref:Uncharacterized protein n=1 Tax=Eleutherodactylus coqui TaxID=57060 RepID=A0A8J6EDG6_ELECQ|nr:hypothetical protein GDO78_015633 [Eleutherodactylus coqui]
MKSPLLTQQPKEDLMQDFIAPLQAMDRGEERGEGLQMQQTHQ